MNWLRDWISWRSPWWVYVIGGCVTALAAFEHPMIWWRLWMSVLTARQFWTAGSNYRAAEIGDRA